MIKTVYYGDKKETGIVLLNTIEVSPIDGKLLIKTPVLEGGDALKLTMLYYHNVNRYGEVLSTMVAMFNLEKAKETSYILYNPRKFGLNSELEEDQTLSGTSMRWRNAELYEIDVSMFSDQSRNATHAYPRYDINADLAQDPYRSNNFMLDGWYSVVSTVPPETPTVIKDGVLRSFLNNIEYRRDTLWYGINGTIFTDVPIADIIRATDPSTAFVEIPFFVAHDTVTLYDKLLTKELDNEWFTGVNKIRYKYRSIDAAAEDKYMDKAQILLKSIDLTLLASK